ncbi:flavin monoamine oxidase family protein [Lunatimonas salinarum]|uniref:flavin monoamine oxidase family protein n=1 Tax=Lunatimonas salinarum TaxID=1774590 RepID=UPI001AE01B44|nr:FAD-dependent oxidoreductase [Lunatimonas salinarum]
MNRKEFIKICGLFGIGLPFQGMVSMGKRDDDIPKPFTGKVLIIGAGAGGLSAGYFLKQQGNDFEIIEASPAYGGRMRINTGFADFPIPLGAEWLEASTSILQEIVNDSSVQVDVKTVADNPDRKFVNYSWFNFFEDYIVPSIAANISFDTIVQSIEYSRKQILVHTNNGQFTADKVVVSVPLQILKDGDIRFIPSLPKSKLDAINDTVVWEGFKAFFDFNTNFYGDNEYVFPITPKSNGQKVYYNAAFGQNTTKNILGLFVVGLPAQDFISRSGDDLRDFILSELDSIYANQATPNYIQHITQNWNNESFIKGGYLTDYEDWRKVRELGNSVADKLYFAGGEYTDGEDWVSVHTAAQSAKRVVGEINK